MQVLLVGRFFFQEAYRDGDLSVKQQQQKKAGSIFFLFKLWSR